MTSRGPTGLPFPTTYKYTLSVSPSSSSLFTFATFKPRTHSYYFSDKCVLVLPRILGGLSLEEQRQAYEWKRQQPQVQVVTEEPRVPVAPASKENPRQVVPKEVQAQRHHNSAHRSQFQHFQSFCSDRPLRKVRCEQCQCKQTNGG